MADLMSKKLVWQHEGGLKDLKKQHNAPIRGKLEDEKQRSLAASEPTPALCCLVVILLLLYFTLCTVEKSFKIDVNR
uniref:Uncharacterized protein n=1 Tax=Fundulus heteroclitus TaxID=8078 RepID=A0A146QXV3_FUNHE